MYSHCRLVDGSYDYRYQALNYNLILWGVSHLFLSSISKGTFFNILSEDTFCKILFYLLYNIMSCRVLFHFVYFLWVKETERDMFSTPSYYLNISVAGNSFNSIKNVIRYYYYDFNLVFNSIQTSFRSLILH